MNIAPYIDHTLLKPDATRRQITRLCNEAVTYGFASVCVNPFWVKRCKQLLTGSGIQVCTVIGFPLGANTPEIKALEAQRAIADGADELDMVINIGALKSDKVHLVEYDMGNIMKFCQTTTLKVIIEACLLTEEEKILACKLAKNVGVDFVKTSTGFSTGGATIEDVALMRKIVGPKMGVKAAGGIKTLVIAKAMLEAGANRLGCSTSVAIVKEEEK